MKNLFSSLHLISNSDRIQIRKEIRTMTHHGCRPPYLHPLFSHPKITCKILFGVEKKGVGPRWRKGER